jgi:hypothetical protein
MNPIEQRLAELERRVERLEGDPRPSALRAAAGDSDPLDLIARLRAGLAGTGRSGAVVYAGAAGFGEREYLWAKEHGTADLAGADWAGAAGTLESLGSPARLALVAALLDGPLRRADLQAALGESSTGQLYHHLRELQAARLVLQRERGLYELAGHAVVPLLAIVAAALDLGTGGGGEP